MPDVEVLGSTMYYEDHGDGTPSDVVQRVEATTHGSRPLPRFQTPAHFDPGRHHVSVDNQVVPESHSSH